MTLLLAPLLLLLAQASSQSGTVPPSPPAPPQFTSHRGGRLFISPMGEPFRPAARDDDGLADWFNQADANHDGRLTLDEMQKDAQRFFATLDVAKDGEIDPDDITRYESEIAPEIQTSRFGLASFDGESRGGERGGGRRQRQGRGPGFFRNDDDQHQGAGRFGLLDLPEPVVSADSDFNRGISVNEFRAAAQQRFLALDLDHHGYLTLPELETIRPAPPSAPKKPDHPRQVDESALPG